MEIKKRSKTKRSPNLSNISPDPELIESETDEKYEVLTKTKGKKRKSESAEKDVSTKAKGKKRKRLIIRNLSFKVDERELRKEFSKFGKVIDVNIPLQKDGKKRGFGFVEFDNTKSLIQAMKAMNYQEIKGRKVAIDFAVSKDRYTNENKTEIKEEPLDVEIKEEVDSDEEDNKSDIEMETESSDPQSKEDKKLNKVDEFMRYFDSQGREDDDDESSSEDSSDDEEETNTAEPQTDSDSETSSDQDEKPKIKKEPFETNQPDKKQSQDVSEGRTVFIRNVSFTTDRESLSEAMKEYGDTEYCLVCTDKLTEQPKGTAFVKFKKKNSVEKLMEAAEQDPGLVLDGRKLLCSLAVSRDNLPQDEKKKGKDNRNLGLLKVGLVAPNTPESEGVSKGDMAKRKQLELVRKQKLRNVNFFVSKTRLAVHNLPKTMSDAELRKLFKRAGGAGAMVTEARVMKEFKRTDAKGNPMSKGFGFVSFTQHENAMNALNELNNHPSVFHPNKRPIVEFSIENKVALFSKEKRREKAQLRNKKRSEAKTARKGENVSESVKTEKSPGRKQSKAAKKKKARKEKMANLKSLKDKKNMYKEKLSKS